MHAIFFYGSIPIRRDFSKNSRSGHIFIFECPNCFELLEIEDCNLGESGTCNKCDHHITIPSGGFQLYTLLHEVTREERGAIDVKVRDGFRAGLSIEGIGAALTEILELDPDRAAKLEAHKQSLIDDGVSNEELARGLRSKGEELLRKRRESIANTYQQIDIASTEYARAKKAGRKWKRWITACDDLVSDVDEANQAAGWIRIDEPFPSGDQHPPTKAYCSCTLTYRSKRPHRYDKKLAKEAVKKQWDRKRPV